MHHLSWVWRINGSGSLPDRRRLSDTATWQSPEAGLRGASWEPWDVWLSASYSGERNWRCSEPSPTGSETILKMLKLGSWQGKYARDVLRIREVLVEVFMRSPSVGNSQVSGWSDCCHAQDRKARRKVMRSFLNMFEASAGCCDAPPVYPPPWNPSGAALLPSAPAWPVPVPLSLACSSLSSCRSLTLPGCARLLCASN